MGEVLVVVLGTVIVVVLVVVDVDVVNGLACCCWSRFFLEHWQVCLTVWQSGGEAVRRERGQVSRPLPGMVI